MPVLRDGFPNFNRAVRLHAWASAANESSRSTVNDERNKFVFDLFMKAADKAAGGNTKDSETLARLF